ncbi:hypothetical protein H9L41_13405 [Chitinimonas koreensis]|nr:hypothetical protein H9L41_13405 [Chitinimonas koreensis]
MQLLCDSTAIVEAWAHDCGGVFVKLPPAEATRGDLAQALNKCVMRMGQMSADFERAIKDGQIDVRECKVLQTDVADLSAAAREFVGLALAVFGTRDVQQALAGTVVSAEGS